MLGDSSCKFSMGQTWIIFKPYSHSWWCCGDKPILRWCATSTSTNHKEPPVSRWLRNFWRKNRFLSSSESCRQLFLIAGELRMIRLTSRIYHSARPLYERRLVVGISWSRPWKLILAIGGAVSCGNPHVDDAAKKAIVCATLVFHIASNAAVMRLNDKHYWCLIVLLARGNLVIKSLTYLVQGRKISRS